jgi:hypothetical protein
MTVMQFSAEKAGIHPTYQTPFEKAITSPLSLFAFGI